MRSKIVKGRYRAPVPRSRRDDGSDDSESDAPWIGTTATRGGAGAENADERAPPMAPLLPDDARP